MDLSLYLASELDLEVFQCVDGALVTQATYQARPSGAFIVVTIELVGYTIACAKEEVPY